MAGNKIFGVTTLILCSTVVVLLLTRTSSISSRPYNPWIDVNNDGRIDMRDIAQVASGFGGTGQPMMKAVVSYDSGWIDTADKIGEYITVNHNLNSSDVIVDITGKTMIDGGVHQRYLGGEIPVVGPSGIYGGARNDNARCVIQTTDGGYAMSGASNSFASLFGDYYCDDYFLVKTDADGKILWNKTYGGNFNDCAYNTVETTDGGYALVGWTASYGFGTADAWLVRTDSMGQMLWNRTYGGYYSDVLRCVLQTDDGGYAMTGYRESSGVDTWDAYLVRTNEFGDMLWNKTYGGANIDATYSMVPSGDGGFTAVGYTRSEGTGDADFWLVKFDADGDTEWSKAYGGEKDDLALSLTKTSDGGYLLVGYTYSFAGADRNAMLLKTDGNGNILWNKTYGGDNDDYLLSVVESNGGGYVMTGQTGSYGSGAGDYWLIKVDGGGDMQWSQTYGGTDFDEAWFVIRTTDGGYAIAGSTYSYGAGGADFWLIKTDSNGNTQWSGDSFKYGLAWVDSTENTITLFRGTEDPYWNYVRVRLWKIE